MRVTKKQVEGSVEELTRLLGKDLVVNQWHQHISVYTKGPNDSCETLIASSNTKRDFVDQVYAAINVLRIVNKGVE